MNTDLKDAKKLAFGLMRLPRTDASDNTSIDIERTQAMVDAFIAEGFTYFDTAVPYHGGQSELVFRETVVKRYPRQAYTITDKLSLFNIETTEEMYAFFEKQFESLGVEYIDYYLLHAMNKDRCKHAEELGAFELIKEAKEAGRLKHIGLSFHDTADVLDDILTRHPELEYVQLQINYLDWEDASVQSRKCYEVAVKHDKAVLVMEPVKGGALVNISEKIVAMFKEHEPEMSVPSWAIRFAASLDNVVMVLSGMSDEQQLADNMSYMKDFKPLTEEEMAIPLEAAQMIRDDIAIPCTRCRYCVDDCPMNIAIPDYFTVYNKYKRFGLESTCRNNYKKHAQKAGLASACIQCGKCEGHCPQNLPIREYLKDVAAALE